MKPKRTHPRDRSRAPLAQLGHRTQRSLQLIPRSSELAELGPVANVVNGTRPKSISNVVGTRWYSARPDPVKIMGRNRGHAIWRLRQATASGISSLAGDVAEWLKAAVC
ncbi:MAG TPA: hypothetical protein VKC60_05845 [Opitutaceae bacterium]|nr:hypothetical protein [Opitutaceae bacterium]